MRLLILLLLTPALFAQSLRISGEVPVAALEAREATGDETAPRIASNGDGYFAVWRTPFFTAQGARITRDGVVLDRPARELGPALDDVRVVSNGETYLVVTTTETALTLTEIAASGVMVNQRTISVAGPDFPEIAWNGSHYLVAWLGGGGATAELLTRGLQSVRTIAFPGASRLALAGNSGVFLVVTGSSARAAVEYSIVSAAGEVSPPKQLQSGTASVGAVAAERHGSGFLAGFSAAVEEIVAIDASGTIGRRVRLEGGGGSVSIAVVGGRVHAATAEWLYVLEPSLEVAFRQRHSSGAITGTGRFFVASERAYDLDVYLFEEPSGPRTLVSYGYQRQFVRGAIWTGDALTLMWEYGAIPVISRLTAGGTPVDGPGVTLEGALPGSSDPAFEGQAALGWNGSRYAVAYAERSVSCCIRSVRVLDGNLSTLVTRPFAMRGSYDKLVASDGRDFLFVDRFGTAILTAEGELGKDDVFRQGTEYWEPPRRALWVGSEYVVLQAYGEFNRIARDGTIAASSEETSARDIATDGRELVGVWREGEQVLAARFTADGVTIGAAIPVMAATVKTVPFIAWDGVSFVVAAGDQEVPAGNLVVRRLRVVDGSLRAGAMTATALPPMVYPTAFTGGQGRSALVYARSGGGVQWQRMRSYVRFVTLPKARAVR